MGGLGCSNLIRAESTGEDPRATGGLGSFLNFLTLGSIKKSKTLIDGILSLQI